MNTSYHYVIRVHGTLSESRWADWFGDTEIRHVENGDTVLISHMTDQAALYGLLSRLRDLALPLISVQLVKGDAD